MKCSDAEAKALTDGSLPPSSERKEEKDSQRARKKVPVDPASTALFGRPAYRGAVS